MLTTITSDIYGFDFTLLFERDGMISDLIKNLAVSVF